jgi:hypothetical protein
MILKMPGRMARVICMLSAPLWVTVPALASPVVLGNATATYCQPFFPVTAAVDGDLNNGNGWAVDGRTPGSSPVAVFQSAANLGGNSGTNLLFRFDHFYQVQHSLGKFRISATTADRSTYAQAPSCDNASAEGTAVWTVLYPQSLSSANGQTLTVQQDGSILVSGTLPDTDVVTIEVATPLSGITGFRVEALADASLPVDGPGRYVDNGNFVLTELLVDAESLSAVPALDAWALALTALLLAGGGMFGLRRRRA